MDKYHNFFTVLKPFDKITNPKQFIINQLNCGEVPLSPFDSCRLGSINLFSLVRSPFTKNAKFDWNELARVARYAQRFMDDIVDLEEEKIGSIITKINNDPEAPEIKKTELLLWEKLLDTLKKGRRTGVGVLGLGDAMAALSILYGTEDATKFAEEVHKYIAINSYRESVKLAKERGKFPVWDADKEAGNAFAYPFQYIKNANTHRGERADNGLFVFSQYLRDSLYRRDHVDIDPVPRRRHRLLDLRPFFLEPVV